MKNQNTSNNKRIAKNTGMLYFRMLLTMLVSLYTVRVVLNALGVVDYGIYNVIGGFVSMMSFLSVTIASASQRFFAIELAKKNTKALKDSFSASLMIFFIVALLCFILFETVGVWFLNTQMTIPPERLNAANWVFQFSIFSFIVSILVSPFTAAIVAHEDMKIYAYVSIIEVTLKLLVVYLLVLFSYDKLELYSFLVFIATLIGGASFIYTCLRIRKYEECSLKPKWDLRIIKPMANFAGWNTVGAIANILKAQGINVLLNIFFGPIVNTARAISFQIYNVFNSFSANIYTAVRPQINKAYAVDNIDYMMELVFKSAKFSYFLLLILSIPLLFETDFVFKLWLGNVPEYTIIFTRLLILNILMESVNNQLLAALQAFGKIRTYQLVVSTLQILVLPISFLFFYLGASPVSTLYVSIIITLLSFIPQIWIVHKTVGLSIKHYFKQVVLVVSVVSVISYIPPFLFLVYMSPGWSRFLLICIVGTISCLAMIFYVGVSKGERVMIFSFIMKKMKRL